MYYLTSRSTLKNLYILATVPKIKPLIAMLIRMWLHVILRLDEFAYYICHNRTGVHDTVYDFSQEQPKMAQKCAILLN